MRRLAASALAVAAAGLALAACAAEGERASSTASPIIEGVDSDASHDAVVLLEHYEGGTRVGASACSGILITPKVVLTARHCVSETQEGGIACSSTGKPISGGGVKADYKPSSIYVFVGQKRPDLLAGEQPVARGAAFVHDGRPAETARDALVADALDRRGSMVRVGLALGAPLVGLGASAPTYYPAVADLLGTPCVTPEHAGVANAVGAVVGRVRLRRQVAVTSPAQGRFLVHADHSPEATTSLEVALEVARTAARRGLEADMAAAGAASFDTEESWQARHAEVEGVDMFVEGTLTLTGTGRPSLV